MIPPMTPENAGECADSHPSAARGAALGADNGVELADASSGNAAQVIELVAGGDAELAAVVDRWATLPEAIRLAILALVRTAT